MPIGSGLKTPETPRAAKRVKIAFGATSNRFKIASRTFTLAILALSIVSSSAVAGDSISVSIINEVDRSPLFAQAIEWWHAGNHLHKRQKSCAQKNCATWQLPIKLQPDYTINFVVIKARNDDATCFDWFQGHLALNTHQRTYQATATHLETACK